jgi:hypothetical protein
MIAERPTMSSTTTASTGAEGMDSGSGQDFASLDAAMEALPVPVEVRAQVRRIITGPYVHIWIPASGGYIAMGDSRAQVAWYVRKTLVRRFLGDGLFKQTELANHGGRTLNDPAPAASAQQISTCPTCFMQLPTSGLCDDC